MQMSQMFEEKNGWFLWTISLKFDFIFFWSTIIWAEKKEKKIFLASRDFLQKIITHWHFEKWILAKVSGEMFICKTKKNTTRNFLVFSL